MKLLSLLTLSFLFIGCGNSHISDPEVDPGPIVTTPVLEKACVHPAAEDFDATAGAKEAGECTFRACGNVIFAEHAVRNSYLAYIQLYGGKIIDDPSLCVSQLDDYSNKCTNPLAYNFQLEESCKYKACSDEEYLDHYEYEVLVSLYGVAVEHDQSKCVHKKYYPGCTDEKASNFAATANTENGSCKYKVCIDPNFVEYDSAENQEILAAMNAYAIANDLSGINLISENTCKTEKEYDVPGCMIEGTTNYNADATVDDKSCRWYACLNSGYEEYDADLLQVIQEYANTNGGTIADYHTSRCETENPVYGCTKEGADNYSASATLDDGSCSWSACLNQLYKEYDQSLAELIQAYIEEHDGSEENNHSNTCKELKDIYGCTSPSAMNNDPDATADNGSCQWSACLDPLYEEFSAELEVAITSYASVHGEDIESYFSNSCSVLKPVYGCMESSAENTDPLATRDDGSCRWKKCLSEGYQEYDSVMSPIVQGIIDAYILAHGGDVNTYNTSTCTVPNAVEGCTQPSADNTDPNATHDNGTCIWTGCIDSGFQEYDSNLEIFINGYVAIHGGVASDYHTSTCSTPANTYGCTVNLPGVTTNYNPNATNDDGSCHFETCCTQGFSNTATPAEANAIKTYLLDHGITFTRDDLAQHPNLTIICEGVPYN